VLSDFINCPEEMRSAVCRSRPGEKQFAGADLKTSSLQEQTWRQAVYGSRPGDKQFTETDLKRCSLRQAKKVLEKIYSRISEPDIMLWPIVI